MFKQLILAACVALLGALSPRARRANPDVVSPQRRTAHVLASRTRRDPVDAPVVIDGSQSGVGTVSGAVIGGVAGSNVGGPRGGAIVGILGAVAGGVIGNANERTPPGRRTRSRSSLQLRTASAALIVQGKGKETCCRRRARSSWSRRAARSA